MTHFRASTDADFALVALGRELARTGYRFVTPSPATHARVDARSSAWAQSPQDIFGWSRPFHAGILPAPLFTLMRRARILNEQEGGWRSTVRLSSLGGTLFFHSAYPTTAPDAVFFGPDTYRFARAIEAHLAYAGPIGRALDMCSGAGPGGIVIARARPDALVLLADINPQAIRLGQVNAAVAQVPGTASVQSDLFAATPGPFDLIVANPPYLVDPAQRQYRHGGGDLGAGLSAAILDGAVQHLAPGGTLLLYTGSAIVEGRDCFAEAASSRLAHEKFGWSYEEIDPDVFGEELDSPPYDRADRIAAVLLTVTRAG